MLHSAVLTADLLLRGAAFALLLLLALRLQDAPASTSRRLCQALALCILGYLLSTQGPGGELPELLGLPATSEGPAIVLATLAPAVFWLFAQSLFLDDWRWRHWYALPLLLMGGLSLLCLWPHEPRTLARLSLLQHLAALALTAHALWLIARDQGADLLNARRTLRLWLGPGIGLYIALILGVELAYPPGSTPHWLLLLNLLGISLIALLLNLGEASLRAWLLPAPAIPSEPAAARSEDEVEDGALLRLRLAMEGEQLWRRESLSVADLAEHLGLPEYRLRRLINGALGQRNFNAYLNRFRVEAACAQLADPARRRLPILSIALDVGFASIGPFNRAFKAQLDCTPSEFRRQHLGES